VGSSPTPGTNVMLDKDSDNPHDSLRRDLEAKQRNVLLPDTLTNARSVDAFLWKGSPNATAVQRAGMVIFGLFYIGVGAFLFLVISPTPLRILLGVPFGGLWAAFGAKILRNAFRRKKPDRWQERETQRYS
jgi:hypothetical protein